VSTEFTTKTVNNTHRILNSAIFKFVVGEVVDGRATVIPVHKEAIEQLSPPFHEILNEAFINNSVTWPFVHKKTFERLAQFAYTGDYSIAKPIKRYRPVNEQDGHAAGEDNKPAPEEPPVEEAPSTPTPEEEYIEEAEQRTGTWHKGWVMTEEATTGAPINDTPEPEPESITWSFNESVQRRKNKKKGRHYTTTREIPEPTDSLPYPLIAPRNNHEDTSEPDDHFDPDGNYTNVFHSHAALWALADLYNIDSLKGLALYKIHKILCVFQVNNENVGDVINLVRHVYSDKFGGQADGRLRGLVAQYMAFNSPSLSSNPSFMALLKEGGLFVEDFFQIVMQRLP
jgi:hypothetical protein